MARAGLLIGSLLLIGAIVAVISQRDRVTDALHALARPSPWVLLMLAGCVCLNMILTGAMFSVLMSRYGQVGRVEMQALVAAC